MGKSYRAFALDERARARRHPDTDRSIRFHTAENELTQQLTEAMNSQRQALTMTGVSRNSDVERARVADRITAGWGEGVSVDHSFASARDDGVMVASR